jgi:hypothetical protein
VHLDDRRVVEAVRPPIHKLERVDVAPSLHRFIDLEIVGIAERHVQEVFWHGHDPLEATKGLLDASRRRRYLDRRKDQPDADDGIALVRQRVPERLERRAAGLEVSPGLLEAAEEPAYALEM